MTERPAATATTEFVRVPRLRPPHFRTDELTVSAPPPIRPSRGGPTKLLPLMAVVATLGVGLWGWSSGIAVSRNPASLLFPAMMEVSVIGMLMQAGGGRGAAELDGHRRRYLDELGRLSAQLAEDAGHQRESLLWVHPEPSTLWTLTGGRRMWERGVNDSDFAHVRVGLAPQRLCRRVTAPATAQPDDLDPVTAAALRRFIHAHTAVVDAPVAIALRGVPAMTVAGQPEAARDLVRAMACQLAVLHSPQDMWIAAALGAGRRAHWDWLKWLPHNGHPSRTGLLGPNPMVYGSLAEAETALADVLNERGPFDRATASSERPHVVVLVDREAEVTGSEQILSRGGPAGVTVVVIGGGRDNTLAPSALRLQIDGDQLAVRFEGGTEAFARVDGLSLPEARACGRRLARYRHPGGTTTADGLQRWRIELGLNEPSRGNPEHPWTPGIQRNHLRVPIGTTPSGDLVELDIKEAAERGTGPHGLCVGATGSGKSELLRIVVLGMIARHSPEELNLVLIDLKGGATFLGMEGLHHIAAVITNLADEAHLVARMKDALAGEIHRRQQLLRRAGNAVNLGAYRQGCSADSSLPSLPSLFIVIDEFAELLHSNPDFIELFTMIGRVGRSLGMHLLLASQRLDEGRLRGLEAHLSYRICLKTLTAAESRAVLGVADAAELPGVPGAALLRTCDGRLTRFQTIYLGGTQRTPSPARTAGSSDVHAFTSAPPEPPPVVALAPQPTVMDAVIERFSGRGSKALRVWLPPLSSSPELGGLVTMPAPDLTAPIGLVDLPFEQRRTPLLVDVGGAAGNVAVVGAPLTGKSATVRTLVTALSYRHDPRRIQFYCIDFGGGALAALRSLPHVGSVATRQERELVARTVSHVESILRSRETLFDRLGIGSIGEYRQRRADHCPDTAADPYGDVFLVLDGWAAVREEFADLEAAVGAIAARGLSLGVHVLITAGRWADIRPRLKDQIGTRIELRLGDPIDSEMDRKQAALVPIDRPGRGITTEGRHFAIATSLRTEVVTDDRWQAPPVRLLPGAVDHDAVVRQAAGERARTLIGLGESELAPVAVDFHQQPHLLIVGDGECGKTATLRTLCRELLRGSSSRPVRMFIVDYRRGLLDVVSGEHLAGYAFSAAALVQQLPGLVGLLESRLPSADVRPNNCGADRGGKGPRSSSSSTTTTSSVPRRPTLSAPWFGCCRTPRTSDCI